MNQFFMEKYYLSTKQKYLLKGYDEINQVIQKNETVNDEAIKSIVSVCEKYGIIIIIVDTSDQIEFLYGNGEILKKRLVDINFGLNPSDYKIIKQTPDYMVGGCNLNQKSGNYENGYLEVSGFFNSNMIFLIRMPVESIHESVKISMQFYARIGLVVSFLGIVIAFLISKEFTKPILKLARISKEMSNLNFNIKYDEDADDEIGVLGNSMNELSDKLESTIIELKQANSDLMKDIEKKEEIDEMRKDFISNVSHELKTPIALIQGYAEGLNECVNDDEESREFYCSVIVDEANKMNKMVKSLLSLNQLEFGSNNIQYEKFDINMVIGGVLNSLDYLIKQYEIQIDFSETNERYVYADEFKIEEVITNYITNAIHYATGEKKIRITEEIHDKTLRVSVFNTGNPIPESELKNIWVKFYKVDKARTREYGGSGIGLSIVKAIMKAHEKQCGVINHEDGVEFWFELDFELV
ncbi:MAG: HAMP domain-containing protein [Lachnospiraceae bacterium]|nr:HAMP domain-containing protein [Lachnospiraceae bacterium]